VDKYVLAYLEGMVGGFFWIVRRTWKRGRTSPFSGRREFIEIDNGGDHAFQGCINKENEGPLEPTLDFGYLRMFPPFEIECWILILIAKEGASVASP
jgi:hypothetical protein